MTTSTRKGKRAGAASLIALALGLGACDEAAGPEADKRYEAAAAVSGSTRFEVRPERIRLEQTGSFWMVTGEMVDAAGQGTKVASSFSSTATGVVSVDSKGWIKARTNGIALIIAKYGTSVDTAEIWVGPATSGSVVLGVDEDSIAAIGGTVDVEVQVLDQAGVPIANPGHVWSTSTPGIVSVSGKARATLTAVGLGKGEVIATHALGADTATIWVGPKPQPTELSLNPDVLLFDQVGSMWMVTGQYTDKGVNSAVSPTLVSTKSSVISASNSGWVKAAGTGTAAIIGSHNGSVDTIAVQVGNLQTASFRISNDVDSIQAAGGTVRLRTEVLHTSGAPILNPRITWSSLTPAIATVSGTAGVGNVTAAANGIAKIVARRGALADTAIVTVGGTKPATPVPASVVVTPDNGTISSQNGTLQLSAQVQDAQHNALSSLVLNWASLDGSIATVSSTGLVKAVANGTARVRVTYGSLADTAVVNVAIPTAGKGPTAPPSQLKTLVEEVIGPVALPPGVAFDSLLTLAETWSEHHWTTRLANPGIAGVNTFNYYDFAALMYYLGALTGDSKWAPRADALAKEYCAYACKPGQMVQPHNWQPRGVEIYARRSGDPAALAALDLYGTKLSRQLDGTATYDYVIGGSNDNMDNRQVGRSILSTLAAVHSAGRKDLAPKLDIALNALEAQQRRDGGARWNYIAPKDPIFLAALMVHALGDMERRGYTDPRIDQMSDRWLNDAWNEAAPTRNCQGQTRTTLPYYYGGTPACYHHTLNGIFAVPFAQRYARTGDPAHLKQVMDLLDGSLASETWDNVGKQFMEVARTLFAAGVVGRAQGY